MKYVLASLIAVGLIGGSQVLAEPPKFVEARTGNEPRPVWVRETDEMKSGTPRRQVEDRRELMRATDKDESKRRPCIRWGC